MNRFSRLVFLIAFWLWPFLRIRVYHAERIPDGPVVIAPKHTDMFNIPAITWSTKREVCYMAKAELFSHWLARWYLLKCRAFPVRRGKPDKTAIRVGAELLRAGQAVGIFGEGERIPGNVVGEIHGGMVSMINASETNCQIVPCGISSKITWRREVNVFYGEPFGLDSTVARDEMCEIIRGKVQTAQNEAVRLAA